MCVNFHFQETTLTKVSNQVKEDLKMERPFSTTCVPVPVARKRLKMLVRIFVALLFLSLVGTGGYLAYKKVSVN